MIHDDRKRKEQESAEAISGLKNNIFFCKILIPTHPPKKNLTSEWPELL